jgi:pimeloyl-ACP methyl ester carboxylesterase
VKIELAPFFMTNNENKEQFYISENEIKFWHKIVRNYFKYIGPVVPKTTARIFWKLFTRPRKRALTPQQRFGMAAAQSRVFQLKGGTDKYVLHVFGQSSKRILICHGWESRTADFLPIIQRLLTEGYSIHAIDFTGHGSAPKGRSHLPLFISIIKDTVIRFNEQYYAAIGHSLGAAALSMAVTQMEVNAIKRLIFLGLHPHPSAFLLQYKSITRISDELFNQCIQYAERKTNAKLLDYDCYKYLTVYAQFKILLIHDTADNIIHVERIRELSNNIISAQVYEGFHGGHFRHYKHPEVIHKIIQFLKTPED